MSVWNAQSMCNVQYMEGIVLIFCCHGTLVTAS